MPDEVPKAMMVGGVVVALLAAGLLEFRPDEWQRVRRPAHAAVCVGGLLFGVGLLIEMLREESKLSHGTIAVFAVCVLLTARWYAAWVVSSRRAET